MPKILIIEDDHAPVESLRARLESAGYQGEAAHDGAAGMEKARTFLPDLLLLDVMTGLNGTGDLDKALTCGAADHINKPFQPEQLLEKILGA